MIAMNPLLDASASRDLDDAFLGVALIDADRDMLVLVGQAGDVLLKYSACRRGFDLIRQHWMSELSTCDFTQFRVFTALDMGGQNIKS